MADSTLVARRSASAAWRRKCDSILGATAWAAGYDGPVMADQNVNRSAGTRADEPAKNTIARHRAVLSAAGLPFAAFLPRSPEEKTLQGFLDNNAAQRATRWRAGTRS